MVPLLKTLSHFTIVLKLQRSISRIFSIFHKYFSKNTNPLIFIQFKHRPAHFTINSDSRTNNTTTNQPIRSTQTNHVTTNPPMTSRRLKHVLAQSSRVPCSVISLILPPLLFLFFTTCATLLPADICNFVQTVMNFSPLPQAVP